MGVSSRTGVISAIYKTDAKDPSHSSLDAIIFIFLNISYIILHNGYFCDLKTNQLLSKKNYITHTFYYTLNEQSVVISLDSFSQGGMGFYFLCPSYIWLWKQIHPYR